jgi:hypothetical protein
MYAQTSTHRPSTVAAPAPSRAVLQTRPLIQRAVIRSWEYRRPYRIAILAIRLLVALWLLVLTAILTSYDYQVGWALLPAAICVAAIAVWVYQTADKGWPVDKA